MLTGVGRTAVDALYSKLTANPVHDKIIVTVAYDVATALQMFKTAA